MFSNRFSRKTLTQLSLAKIIGPKTGGWGEGGRKYYFCLKFIKRSRETEREEVQKKKNLLEDEKERKRKG